MSTTRPRVAFIFTHQIQYFTNLLDELHCRGNLDVFCVYANRTQDLHDVGFAKVITWDNRQNAQFPSVVLPRGWSDRALKPQSTLRMSVFSALNNFNPDVVHVNGFSNIIQWQALLWARMKKRKVVARGDGDTLHKLERTKRSGHTRVMTSLFCRQVDHFFFQGLENQKYWLDRGASEDRMTWVPCVPDSRVYRQFAYPSTDDRDEFRASVGVKPHDIVFVVSGKLDSRKRPHDALEALAKVRAPGARLWFVGSGILENALRAKTIELGIQERVHFWGFQNQTRLPRILQAADVCLHTSERDPWPYSVLECAISGQVLLISDRTGSHPDLVGDVGGGLTFSCGDVDELSCKMNVLCSDDEMRRGFRDRLTTRLSVYTEAVFCEIFEGVIRTLTTPAGRLDGSIDYCP
jgi:glycosyltransferase involved in cell wall biosynthesis